MTWRSFYVANAAVALAAVVCAAIGWRAPEVSLIVVAVALALDALLHIFVRNTAELRELGPGAIRALKPDGLLWITYPKGGKTRGVTDLPATPWWHRRDVLGEITGETGYEPVAQVAIDDHWTALRFKRRSRE